MTIAEFFVKTAKIAKFNSISVSLSKLVESEERTLDFYECIDDVDSCLRCDTPFQNCRKHVEAAFSKGSRINRRQPLKITPKRLFTNKLTFTIFSLVTKRGFLYGPAQLF